MISINEYRQYDEQDEHLHLIFHDTNIVVAWRNGKAITKEKLIHDAYTLASQLPTNQYAFNLCEDRYWFLVGFVALLINRQTSLLPPNRAIKAIEEIAEDYDDCFCLCDTDYDELKLPIHRIGDTKTFVADKPFNFPVIPGQHLAAIVFTSGSTGKSRPNLKFWRDLVAGSKMKQKRFGFGEGNRQQSIIATVPPQHMYGLETSILNPLINNVIIYTGPTFFPIDICTALSSVPEPRVLVTTPIHMKTCIHSEIDWPIIDFVISATAPLDRSVASLAESKFNCPVLEIYGCTEAGSLASRRTITDDSWLLYEGSYLRQKSDGYYVTGPNLPSYTLLQDIIEPINSHEFILHGRNNDMINIAGKRASLADLNIRLNRIKGVDDGVIIEPNNHISSVAKLIAFVVAPSLNADTIRKQLALEIDTIFLPRTIYFVNNLPRNETGKLPRTAMLEMLDNMRNDN